MKKFIIIDHEPWTKNSETFLNPFRDAGLPFEVWNINKFVHKKLKVDGVISLPPNGKYINNIKDLICCLDNEKSPQIAVIEYFPRIWRTRKILKELAIRKIPSIRIENYGNTFSRKIPYLTQIQNLSIKELYNKITSKIAHYLFLLYNAYHNIPPRELVLSSNSTVFRTHAYNNPDYDNYKFNHELPIIQSDYIVFCDIYFPHHPDLKIHYGSKLCINDQHYYMLMNKVFKNLEEKYNMPVIIAAHPKSNYKGNEFNGRRIIKYKTNNLICNSKGVITHHSASLSYVMLSNKPLIFINVDDFNIYPCLRNIIKDLACSLGHKWFDINSEFKDWEQLKLEKIDEDIRKKYIYSFLTSKETENVPNYITLKNILSSL